MADVTYRLPLTVGVI